MPTIGEALGEATSRLTEAGGASPRLDAEVLLAHALACGRTQLHVRWREPLGREEQARYRALVERRVLREPVAYLVGERAFYDVDLIVSPAVLIPRPETEHTVELALAWAKVWRAPHPDVAMRIVDVGTGSGALAIALARHIKGSRVTAVDVSPDALAVASKNVAKYDLGERIELVHGDLLAPIAGTVDLVVANLPYVRSDEIATLDADVAAFEPHLALDGGADGLDLVRRIAPQLAARLASPGLALLEVDPRQTDESAEIMRRALPEASLAVHKDLAGWERVVSVERCASLPIQGA